MPHKKDTQSKASQKPVAVIAILSLFLIFILLTVFLLGSKRESNDSISSFKQPGSSVELASMKGRTYDQIKTDYGEPTRTVSKPGTTQELWLYEDEPREGRNTYIYFDNGIVYQTKEASFQGEQGGDEEENVDEDELDFPNPADEDSSEPNVADDPDQSNIPDEEDVNSDLEDDQSAEPEDPEEETPDSTAPPLIGIKDLLDREKEKREGQIGMIQNFKPQPSIFDSVSAKTISEMSKLGDKLNNLPLIRNIKVEKRVLAVILDEIEVLDDTDPGRNGELQVIATVATKGTTQKTTMPATRWYEAGHNDHVKINKPIFILPKNQLGDRVAISILAYDNDELPVNASQVIDKYYDATGFAGELLGIPFASQASDWINSANQTFFSWLGSDEQIGHHVNILNKNDNFDLGTDREKTIRQRSGKAIFTYRILDMKMPENPVKVTVILKDFEGLDETGDTGNEADVSITNFVSDGYDTRGNMAGKISRIPKTGNMGVGDNEDRWNMDKVIYTATTSSPLLYIESGIWDDDGVSSNPELLGMWRRTINISNKGNNWTSHVMKGTGNEYGKSAKGRAYIQVKIRPAD